MNKNWQHILIGIILIFIIGGCKQKEVEGIIIEFTLYVHQDYDENKLLRKIIKETLQKDQKALRELIRWDCGGGAGCYDLGFIVSQIIYKIGEKDFTQFTKDLNDKDQKRLILLIRTGLEYGDHNKDGKEDNKLIEDEFPEVYKVLNEK